MTIKVNEDIVLRQIMVSDFNGIFDIINNQREYLGKWLPFVEYTREPGDTKTFIESVVNSPDDRFEHVFTIRYKNEIAGIIGFKGSDKANRKTEIGYWLSEDKQGIGIVTRAVKKLCDFAFKEQYINRIQIKCAVGNIPSSNIPKRLGFKFEGIERGGELLTNNNFADLEVYSILKTDKLNINY